MNLYLPEGAPHDLFITDALDSRPRGKPDYAKEGRAIQALAVAMADDPQTVLPQFVDLALRVTGAASSGLSLWEVSPELGDPGVFRWCFLRGTLSRFEGATTPRNHSPCGVTLDRNAPQLTRQPARAYEWIGEAKVEAPEVLLVPLRLSGGEPFGTLWVVSDAEGRFTRDHATLLTELAESVSTVAAQWDAQRRAQPTLQ